MNRLDLTGFRCQPERSGRDMEKLRGLAEGSATVRFRQSVEGAVQTVLRSAASIASE
jgi:hypothetical protein